jgi:hypothetical protein
MRTFSAVAFLCLLLVSSQAITTYTFDFDTLAPYGYNEYHLGYHNGGTTIRVSLTTPGTQLKMDAITV